MILAAFASAALVHGIAGLWTTGDDYLEFRLHGGQLRVEGSAIWPGRKPAYRPGRYRISPHVGEFSGEAIEANGQFTTLPNIEEPDCRIWGSREGARLVVSDNYKCGGTNVSYRGVYRRAPPGARIPERADEPPGSKRWAKRRLN